HEHRRGERQIGDRERPAQTRLAPEKFEHADVESNEFHAADIKRQDSTSPGTLREAYSSATPPARNAPTCGPRRCDRHRTLRRGELSQADETRLCAMIVSHHACLRSIDDTIFADFERADNVYCCA